MTESYRVRLDFEVSVDLPEGCCPPQCQTCEGNGHWRDCPSAERAVEAAVSALAQVADICLDGLDKPAARVFVEVCDADVMEVRCE